MTIKKDNPVTSVPISYLHRFDELLAERNIMTDRLLAEVGIPLTMSELGDQALEIELDKFEALFLLSIIETKDNSLGFYLGNRMSITTHGILGYAAMSGHNLRQSIQTIVRYFKTLNQLIRLTLREEGALAILQIDDNYNFQHCRNFFHEVVASAINCLLNVVTNHNFAFSDLCFAYPEPKNVESYEALFDCTVHFDCRATQLRFPKKLLDLPLTFADKNAHAMAAKQCEQQLEAIRQNEDLTSQIRMILLDSKGQYSSADDVAEKLNITQRTLRRRLAKDETSFTEILSEVRHQHALEYMQNTQLKISEIAYLLGYSDPNNFGRAFKKWTNQTPVEYRSCFNE